MESWLWFFYGYMEILLVELPSMIVHSSNTYASAQLLLEVFLALKLSLLHLD